MKKNKAYILAFQRATNYGAVLQIYALKTTLEKLGLEVKVIDYIPNWMQVSLKNQPNFKSFVKRKIMNFTFKSFFKKLNLTNKKFYDNKSLKKYLQDGEFYFVGSDQVWNEKIIKKDSTYFLNFAPKNSKKIGYAVSMGNNPLSDDFKEKISPFINQFDYISARESYVTDFIENKYPEKNVPVVLDPTLLLSADDYAEVKNNKKWDKDFIVVYAAMHDNNLYELAKNLSNKTTLPIINLGYHFSGADKQEYIWGPENWLNRMKEAKYIITNSFHGTVFSVIYKKAFFTVPNQNPSTLGLNARFIELLESIGLSERLVYSTSDLESLLEKNIDYENAHRLLEKRKEKSMSFLIDVVQRS